ncbi:MAG: hypothetical protein HKN58_09835 [Xanthomonadales bacterium]|nr:hypothetical protein [Xanthomonadales bacterium]
MLAIIEISGIITTILGKTATNTKVAGRENGYITPKACLSPSLGRGFFLSEWFVCAISNALKNNNNFRLPAKHQIAHTA